MLDNIGGERGICLASQGSDHVLVFYLCDLHNIQGSHSNFILKFPVFSLSDRKFSCANLRVTITYTKLTWQTYPLSKINWIFFEIFAAKIEISFTFRI